MTIDGSSPEQIQQSGLADELVHVGGSGAFEVRRRCRRGVISGLLSIALASCSAATFNTAGRNDVDVNLGGAAAPCVAAARVIELEPCQARSRQRIGNRPGERVPIEWMRNTRRVHGDVRMHVAPLEHRLLEQVQATREAARRAAPDGGNVVALTKLRQGQPMPMHGLLHRSR